MKTDMELRQERDAHRKAARQIGKQLRQRSRKAHGLPQRKKGMGCRIGDRDFAAMEAREFLDRGSYIRRDGSEKLVGRDWVARVEELAERSGGQCEQRANFDGVILRCSHCAVDPQHIVKRSVRRDDRMSNLEHLCRLHHNEKHPEFKIRSGKAGA